MSPKIPEIAKYLSTKRPLWKLQAEDDIVSIGTGQSLIEWPIFRDIEDLFKVKVRNVTSINGIILVTVNTGEQS